MKHTLAYGSSIKFLYNLGVFKSHIYYNGSVLVDPDVVLGIPGVFDLLNGTTYKPFEYAILISFPYHSN